MDFWHILRDQAGAARAFVHLDRLTDHFRRFITKDRLRSLINDLNQPLFIDGDNGIREEVDDAVEVHLCPTSHIDIGQRQDDTFASLLREIRENSHQEPASTRILNF